MNCNLRAGQGGNYDFPLAIHRSNERCSAPTVDVEVVVDLEPSALVASLHAPQVTAVLAAYEATLAGVRLSPNDAMIRPSDVIGDRLPLPDVVTAHHRASEGVVIVAPWANLSAFSTAALVMTTRSSAITARIAGSECTSDFFFVLDCSNEQESPNRSHWPKEREHHEHQREPLISKARTSVA